MTATGSPGATTSIRPGTGPAAARPSTTRSSSTPSVVATEAASSALSTLNRPLSGITTLRPRHRNEVRPTAVTISVASAPRTGMRTGPAGASTAAASRRPQGSSTLTTADRARDGSNSRALAAKYSSIEPWWSRWSRLRLVKATTSNTMASTRCWVMAWDDTSMATAARPASRNSARRRWRSGDSGVVRSPASVPITPVATPAWSRTAWTRWVTVVFPLVPVTPTMRRSRQGWP